MEIRITFEELSEIATSAAKRTVEVTCDGENCIHVHTVAGTPFFSFNIDLSFTVYKIDSNRVFATYRGGIFSRKALKTIANNKYFDIMKDHELIVKVYNLLPSGLSSYHISCLDIQEECIIINITK